MRSSSRVFVAGLLPACVVILSVQTSQADSATWNLNLTSGDWNTATNWTPQTIPNGPSDTARFATSKTTSVSSLPTGNADGVIAKARRSTAVRNFPLLMLATVRSPLAQFSQ